MATIFRFGTGGKGRAGTSDVGVPSFDTCTIGLGDPTSEGFDSYVTYGWSVLPATAADWKALVARVEKRYGQYVDVTTIPVGSGGIVYYNTAMALVGKRIIEVSFNSSTDPQKDLTAAIKDAAAVAGKVPMWPAKIVIPQCSGAQSAVRAALGGTPSVVREQVQYKLPMCAWATDTASVAVSAYHEKGALADLKDQMKEFQGKKVSGIGTFAFYYADDSGDSGLNILSDNGNIVIVGSSDTKISQAALAAIAKALIKRY